MRAYLRVDCDPLERAIACHTISDAVSAFRRIARDLGRFEQRVEATLHFANSRGELAEYPDRVLSVGPRGGIRVERT
jgi:hypothetical protein